jgi:hypothetical protein
VQIQTNQARYDPADRNVECLGGARGSFKEGTVQAERIFWSLRDQVMRVPDTAMGTMNGIPFTADGMVVDLKQRTLAANHAHLRIRIDKGATASLP